MKKIIIAIALTFAMLFSCVGYAGTAKAEEPAGIKYSGTIGTINWSIDDAGVLLIEGTGDIPDYSSSNRAPWSTYGNMITHARIADGITSIGSLAFYGCYNLESVDVSATVTSIKTAAFIDNYQLTSVNGMEGVVTFGDYVFQDTNLFYSVNTLKEIYIPSKLSSIGSEFSYCTQGLENIYVSEDNPYYSSDEGILFNKDKTLLIAYPAAKTGESYVIPDGVQEVANYAFAYQQYLQSVTISDQVITLGEGAFYSMTSLKIIKIPASVTYVGMFLLEGCTSLEELHFYASVESTSYRMCMGCTSLKEATFDNPNIQSFDLRTFMDCTALETVNLPDNLKTIHVYAFKNCGALTHLDYPLTISYIEAGAFSDSGINEYPDWLIPLENGDYIKAESISVTGTIDYDYAFQVLDLVNQERSAAGAAPLFMDPDLLDAAMKRAAEISVSFSHTRPNGTDCFTACDKMFGENIAVGQYDPAGAMNSWMNSSGHRANILSSSFTSIGVGCFYVNGCYHWVQCFGDNSGDAASASGTKTVTEDILISDQIFEKSVLSLQGPSVVAIGTQLQLSPQFHTEESWNNTILDPKNLTWSSDNPSIASVTEDGTIMALSEGSTIIHAFLYDKEAQFTLHIQKAQPKYGWNKIDGKWYYYMQSMYGEDFFVKGWLVDGGYWYYMDLDTGEMRTGWVKDGNLWFYMDASGRRQSGWISVDGTWYFLDYYFGDMQTGWIKLGNTWYYLDPQSGAMQTGFQTVDGKKYYFAPSGAMATGWVKDNGNWYYMNGSGAMAFGWVKVGNTWYYMDPQTGVMQTGWLTIGGAKYYLNASGAMAIGWVKDGDIWYYMNSSGAMVTGWQLIGGVWYYFDQDSGIMMQNGVNAIDGKLYAFGPGGEWISGTGWQKYTYSGWIYTQNGTVVTGWKKINGTWYYFYPGSGVMVSQNIILDEKVEQFNASGAWQGTRKTVGWVLLFHAYYGWYYVEDTNGNLAKGWKTINGVTYYFSLCNGSMYYDDGSFRAIASEIDGKYYHFDENGALRTGRIDTVYGNGELQRGWLTIDGNQYYCYPDDDRPDTFVMYRDGIYTIDGVDYYFDENGVCIQTR